MTSDSPAPSVVQRSLARLDCEHVAALLKSAEEVPPVVASFLELGAARNGWLVHGSRPGQSDEDRARLTEAGLDVAGLMRRGQLEIMELDLTLSPDEWVRPWASLLRARMAAGFDALWFARFPIGPDGEEIAGVLPFEDAWMRCFAGHRVVTLCPYVLGGPGVQSGAPHPQAVAAVHDRLLDADRGWLSAS